MAVFQRLSRLWPRRVPARRKRPVSSRLQIEPLEQRALLSLTFLGQWNGGTPQYSDGWVVDNLAFLVHFGPEEGVHVIDVSDPTDPVEISRFLSPNTTNDYRDVEVQWQLVNDQWRLIGYASGDGPNSAQRQNGVVVIDFTDPYNPAQLFKITAAHGGANQVHTLSVRDQYLYEADSRTRTIRVFNVVNPANPTWVRNIDSTLGDPVHEVTVQGGRLYTANIFGEYSVDIFDVSRIGEQGNPVTHLGRVSGKEIGEWPHTVWPTDDGLYMATTREATGGTLAFWDIQDPAAPRRLWEIGRPTTETCCVHQVIVRGNTLFASWYAAGLFVYDISDPNNPVEIGSYDTYPGNGYREGAWGIFGFWGDKRVFGFDRQSGLFIFTLERGSLRGPDGGSFEGSTSRAVRGRWAEGRDVATFPPDQIARVTGDTLTLTLGAGDDTVSVSRGGGRTIDVHINGTLSFRYDAAPLRQLNVRALEGDDRIVLDPDLGLRLFLDGGPGDDRIEGWRADYRHAPVTSTGTAHSAAVAPYQAIAIEQFVTIAAVRPGVLDYSAHGLLSHGGTAATALGTEAPGVMSHLGGTSTVTLAAPGSSSRAVMIHMSAAMPEKGEHEFQGLRTQVVYHKPYCY